jgi:hypothetical protein
MDSWPQIVLIVLIAKGLVTHIVRDGEANKYDGKMSVISSGLLFWLLWCGEFFG